MLSDLNGFDLVAEELDAHGLRLVRREDIEDAAANGVLAHHFHGVTLRVADAFRSEWIRSRRRRTRRARAATGPARRHRGCRREWSTRPPFPRGHASCSRCFQI